MVGVLLLWAACDSGKEEGVSDQGDTAAEVAIDEDTAPPEVSWYRDIQPLLQENCLGCHADQGISFSLEDMTIAAAMGDAMVDAVSSGRMPPWPADEESCLPLSGTRTLTSEQVDLLSRWVALGAPAGSPDDVPATEQEEARVFEADISLMLPEPFTPSITLEDDYRCFVLDPGLTESTFVTGIQVEPGNANLVHHVILYTDPAQNSLAMDAAEDGPGYTCFGGPGYNNTGVIGGWAPGQGTVWMPEGVGLRLNPDTPVVAQIHYHAVNAPGESDQTVILMDTADQVDKEGFLVPLAHQGIDIPAGVSSHVETRQFSINFGLDATLWGGTPHMHLLGSSIRITVQPPDSDEEVCLIDVPEWDFDYQNFYQFEEPVTIQNGSTITMECIYDNSAQNPNQPADPPVDVDWGDGTNDEMCLVFALLSL
jgi:hypothetical protein